MIEGTISKRNDGRYELKIDLGIGINGKRKRKSFYGKTKKEVKIKRDKWIKENILTLNNNGWDIDNKALLPKNNVSSISFSEWADKWLIIYKKGNVREYTYENTYHTRVDKYLKPYFNQKMINEITSIDIQMFFKKYNYLSIQLLKTLYIILNDMFNKAMDNDLCEKNPTKNINLQSTYKPKEKKTLTAEEQKKAIDWCKNNKYYDILTILKTGMRRGELIGLKWTDYDPKNLIISINESISPPARRDGEINYEVKTLSSKRQIPIDKELADCLNCIPHDSERIFNCTNANAYGKRAARVLTKMCQECNIPQITLHELRHTYGTLLREKGVDIYTISKLLGHSSINVTASIYVHNDIEVLRRAIGY